MSVLSQTVKHKGRRSKKWIFISLLFLVIATIVGKLAPMWLRDDLYGGDASQHAWWLYRFADPQLFPNDLAAKFMSMPIYSPPGYQAIFRITAGLIDPQHLSETLAILLALLSAYLCYRIGKLIGGWVGAVTALLAFALLPIIELHEGGFPRSFGLPIVLGAMLAIRLRKWWLFGLVCLASSIVYPPVFLNIAPVGLIIFIIGLVKSYFHPERDMLTLPKTIWPTVLGIFLGLVAMLNIARVYLKPLPPEVGSFYTYKEAKQMPEWSKEGRNAFFRGPTAFYYHGPTSGIGLPRDYLFLALTCLALTLARNHRIIIAEVWALLLFSVLMWGLAHLLLFKLYLPSRYTTYSLPTFAIFWAAGLGGQIFHDFRRVIARRYYIPASMIIGIVCIPMGVIAINSGFTQYLSGSQWKAPAGFEEAISKIKEMPKDVLIAAHPVDANAIPMRSRHSVLVNGESSIAYHRVYYAEMQKRLYSSFAMFYATDWRVVDALADQYGVSVFLVNQNRLRNLDSGLYYQPFRTTNAPLIEQGRKQGFVMLSVPKDRILFQSGDVVLVKVGTGK